ncbi:MAG: HU family DNA-binding protein [Deinococcus sp.]
MTKGTRKAPAKTSAKTPTSKLAAKKPSKPAAEEAGKIGKTQLVDLITDKGTLTKREAAAAVDAMLEVVVDGLRSGKSVGLPGLGTFTVKATAARQGVRPGTSEKIQIAAGKKVSYKVAVDLKKSL